MTVDERSFRNPRSAFEIQRKVFCIIGDERVFNARSPEMFTSVFHRLGLKGVYVPFMAQPDKVEEAVNSLRVLNIAGANITVPYKEAVIPHLDVLSEGAKIIGAINTIAWDGGVLKGYNTNAIGFMDTLEDIGFEVSGKRALVFGSGGIAKAAVFILNWLRAETVMISGRNENRARDMADRLGGQWIEMEALLESPFPVDIIINATPVSDVEEAPELSGWLDRFQPKGCGLLMDFNYGRSNNFWERKARNCNIRFSDGLMTLAYQARRTFSLWTGVQVQPQEFLNAVDLTSHPGHLDTP
jgi:shikimate dehydrogenase